MKTKWNQTGRSLTFFNRRPPRSNLLHLLLLFSLLILFPACLVSSCSRDNPEGSGGLDAVEVALDSSRFTVRLRVLDNIADDAPEIKSLDILMFDSDGMKNLLAKRRYETVPDSIVFYGKGSGRIVVAVANAPGGLKHNELERFDGAEQLRFAFVEDNPLAPVMGGFCTLEAGCTGSLTLTPLLARVRLGEVSNKMKGYVRMENPRLFLENLNPDAEVLREGGFRPSSIIETGAKTSLPYDIGVFAQHPETEVFCYPNDSQQTSVGTPPTRVVLECEIGERTKQFRVELPAVRRNTTTTVDFLVWSDSDFEGKVY